MTIEEALEELRQAADAFAAVGDANEIFIKGNYANDEEYNDALGDFTEKMGNVYELYKYIFERNHSLENEDFMEATEIIMDIAVNNSSLIPHINSIINLTYGLGKANTTTQKPTDKIDKEALKNRITSYVKEIMNMQNWEPEYVNNIEYQLKKLQETLVNNRNQFDTNEYDYYMNNIDAALNKIDKFNSMINSDTFKSLTESDGFSR